MAFFRNTTGTLEHPRPVVPATGVYKDLIEGLVDQPRRIPSKYFYDAAGSEIFTAITKTPEYYLTSCEDEILRENANVIVRACASARRLNIIELGAGDGSKTRHLLREAQHAGLLLSYTPVDISLSALTQLERLLEHEIAGIVFDPVVLDLERELSLLPLACETPNLILYLGSSIGNLTPTEQLSFLRSLKQLLNPGDGLLVGFDLKKPREIMLPAYNDGAGWTREFNINLLRRLNREVNADFDVDGFKHQPLYNPKTGAMESWLVSLHDQNVHLWSLGLTIQLKAFEAIHTETSWKFSPDEITAIADRLDFHEVDRFTDRRGWFTDVLWRQPF